MSQMAGDASSKTGGNLDHVILDLEWMTVVLYWKQYKVADIWYRGLVDDWYQVRLRECRVVLYGRQYNREKPVQGWKRPVLTV